MAKSVYHETKPFWKRLLEIGLYEDQIHWDWTSKGLINSNKSVESTVIAKSPGVWVLDGLVGAVQNHYGQEIEIKTLLKNGDLFAKNKSVLTLKGPAVQVLGLERTFLNVASYGCGIAYQTKLWVDEIQRLSKERKIKNPPRLTATRKTLPYYKEIELEAVVLGGGYVHRPHLGGGILIKENHIRVAGSVEKAIQQVAKSAPHGLKIEVEVTNLQELKQALDMHQVHGVLLDNFEKNMLLNGLKLKAEHARGKEVFIEVSGGLSLETLSQAVFEGVDLLSSGKLTHSVQGVDFSLQIKK